MIYCIAKDDKKIAAFYGTCIGESVLGEDLKKSIGAAMLKVYLHRVKTEI